MFLYFTADVSTKKLTRFPELLAEESSDNIETLVGEGKRKSKGGQVGK